MMQTKYSKIGVETSDYINQYCDHRYSCRYQGKQCCLMQMPDMVANRCDKNIAYVEGYNCPNYRTDEDGIVGADVVEIGCWR